MSRLLRITYGHGGTRGERICVSAAHPAPPPAPLLLRLAFLAVWIAVPLLVSRFGIPTASHLTTVIDLSRLELTPPVREPPRVKPAGAQPEPAPAPLPAAQTPPPSPPEEAERPAISRPTAPGTSEAPQQQPRIARERLRLEAETGTPAETRIRRETTASEAPAARTVITRSRGDVATDSAAALVRAAPLRRAPAAEVEPAGATASQRPVTRRERPSGLAGTSAGNAPRIAVARERTPAAAAGDGEAATVGLVRGVALMSLEICASPREEEDAIKAVLGVVGARQSCTDGKGTFQFRGTGRISSFNLMIFPANGRRPSNRCEELENAYRCLKSR